MSVSAALASSSSEEWRRLFSTPFTRLVRTRSKSAASKAGLRKASVKSGKKASMLSTWVRPEITVISLSTDTL